MKAPVLLLLMVFVLYPYFTDAQNEGVKNISSRQVPESPALIAKATQEMAMVQDADKTGGAAGEADYLYQSSMFLEPGWAEGYVILSDKTVLENIKIRYDLYNQQMQFIQHNDTFAFKNPEELLMINLDGKRFIYTDLQNGGVIGKGYFELVVDGPCQLLLRRTIKYHMTSEATPRLTDEVFIRENEYYVRKSEDAAKPVRVCRKSVLCALKDKEEEVKSFIDENNLKMKTCDQLMLVVDFYNTLE